MKTALAFGLVLSLAACGSGAKKATTTTAAAKTAASTLSAAKLRPRVQAFCGNKFDATLGDKLEGCEWVHAGLRRSQVSMETEGDHVTSFNLLIVGPAADADDMRAKALSVVQDLFDAKGRDEIARAQTRLYQKSVANLDSGGWVGDVHVRASTEVDVERPEERWIFLELAPTRPGDEPHPFTAVASSDKEFPSPAKPVTDSWLADAEAGCKELVDAVSKSHKMDPLPPKWVRSDVHASCVHPDENIVGQFVVTYAPASHKLVYARFAAELPLKKYTQLAERLFVPLLSPAQVDVMRKAIKKATEAGRLDADGLQIGSRHDTGGFYGESHELEISVQTGYDAGE